MNRFEIINKIGDKYHIGNTESGEFSYAQALKSVGKDIKDYQKGTSGTQHQYLDLRFENERLAVLIETKNKFSKWDKIKIQTQLQDYVRFEKAYSDKKIVAILAEIDGDEVWVWYGQSVIIDDEHRIEEETILRPFEEYENLCFGKVNDKIKVVDSIKTLNEKLHSDGINEKLRNEKNGLFIVTVLDLERYRYSFGRKYKPNLPKAKIKLPAAPTGEPDWEYMEKYIDSLKFSPITTNINGNYCPLNTKEWKEFYLHKLFVAGMGNGIDAIQTTCDEPKYNYVSRDSNGNGVVGFVDEIEGEEPFPAGAMSLALGGSFLGSCFIQKKPFYTAQNVAVLQEKVPLSDHTKLFIATLIRNECKVKYQAFGRELNAHFRKDFTIKLPVKRNADGIVFDDTHEFSDDGYIPDWEWMDSYMRSLPYGDRI